MAKDPWRAKNWQPLSWVRDHIRVGSESLHFVSARVGTSFLVWLVVGIALALPAGLWILQVNMDKMSAGWEGSRSRAMRTSRLLPRRLAIALRWTA